MQSSAMFQKPSTWHSTESEKTTTSNLKRWTIIGLAAVVVLVFASGLVIGHGPVSGLEARNTVLKKTVTSLDHQVQGLILGHARCYTDTSEVSDIQAMINRAEYASAAALAQVALSDVNKPVCPQTKAGLGALWYSASTTGLLSQASPNPVSMAQVWTWKGIEREANALGLPPTIRMNPLTGFSMAYEAHDWRLARAAFEEAWNQQIVGQGNVGEIVQYYADLRNLGLALANQTAGSARAQGIRILATANAIDNRYGLDQGEAASDLIRLTGSTSGSKSDWSDPVLVAAGHR